MPDLIGVPPLPSILRFLPAHHMELAAPPPQLTAAAVDSSPLAALARMQNGNTTYVNNTFTITIDGALDPIAVGRQIEDVMRRYGRGTSGQVAIRMG